MFKLSTSEYYHTFCSKFAYLLSFKGKIFSIFGLIKVNHTLIVSSNLKIRNFVNCQEISEICCWVCVYFSDLLTIP